jgi:hypothetical protein
MNEKKLIDESFYIIKKSYGLWDSTDKEGKGLITSFTEESCINATRSYLKWLQEGFPEAKSYDVKVNGKI